jgi:hypothetical protein
MQAFEYYSIIFLVIFLVVWIKSSKNDENKEIKKILNKFSIYIQGILFMIIAKDSKGLGPSKNPDPDLIKGDSTSFKRIIFIRHGESDWNDVFNKGFGPNFFVRLFGALFREFLCFASFDSGILDKFLT